ncbi:MAG: glycosyltransferase, partial [Campylobacterales bacterium]|nr:glycosyltransferase [Campylobacterales bacterium]
IKDADIYVQPSRFEGKSIAIEEAKILLKPIIVTKFDTVNNQIVNGRNGMVVEISSKGIADGVHILMSNDFLRNQYINNLSNESLGTEQEINKLYNLIQ